MIALQLLSSQKNPHWHAVNKHINNLNWNNHQQSRVFHIKSHTFLLSFWDSAVAPNTFGTKYIVLRASFKWKTAWWLCKDIRQRTLQKITLNRRKELLKLEAKSMADRKIKKQNRNLNRYQIANVFLILQQKHRKHLKAVILARVLSAWIGEHRSKGSLQRWVEQRAKKEMLKPFLLLCECRFYLTTCWALSIFGEVASDRAECCRPLESDAGAKADRMPRVGCSLDGFRRMRGGSGHQVRNVIKRAQVR